MEVHTVVACHKRFPFTSLPSAKKKKSEQKEENLILKKNLPYFPSVKYTSSIFSESCFKTDTNAKYHGGLGFMLYKYVLNVHLGLFTIVLGFLK